MPNYNSWSLQFWLVRFPWVPSYHSQNFCPWLYLLVFHFTVHISKKELIFLTRSNVSPLTIDSEVHKWQPKLQRLGYHRTPPAQHYLLLRLSVVYTIWSEVDEVIYPCLSIPLMSYKGSNDDVSEYLFILYIYRAQDFPNVLSCVIDLCNSCPKTNAFNRSLKNGI